jgi:large subunit ribosomal protein L17
MRHNVHGRKLGRTTAHRTAMFRNQLASLVEHEGIVTTLPKAKELRPIAEKMITQGRTDTVHSRRQVRRWLADRDLIKKLFEEISPRYKDRPGGYLRITRLGPRKGDGAELAKLEFVESED